MAHKTKYVLFVFFYALANTVADSCGVLCEKKIYKDECGSLCLCPINFYVQDNACARCPVGSINNNTDDLNGGDTGCVIPITRTMTFILPSTIDTAALSHAVSRIQDGLPGIISVEITTSIVGRVFINSTMPNSMFDKLLIDIRNAFNLKASDTIEWVATPGQRRLSSSSAKTSKVFSILKPAEEIDSSKMENNGTILEHMDMVLSANTSTIMRLIIKYQWGVATTLHNMTKSTIVKRYHTEAYTERHLVAGFKKGNTESRIKLLLLAVDISPETTIDSATLRICRIFDAEFQGEQCCSVGYESYKYKRCVELRNWFGMLCAQTQCSSLFINK